MKENGLKELFWFVAIFVGLGILWFATGGSKSVVESVVQPSVTSSNGPVGESTQSGLFGNLGGSSGNNNVVVTGFTFAGAGSGSGSGSSGSGSAPEAGSGVTGSAPSYDQKEFAWVTNKSPYFKEITLDEGSVGTQNSGQEYLELHAYSGNAQPISISGWRLLSLSTGNTATIGEGAILPFVGGTNVTQPIDLAANDDAYVITGTSPIGVSFQENECTGYFQQFNNFYPGLNSSCPSIEDHLPTAPNQLNNACLDYLESFPQCRTVTQAIPPGLPENCQQFINNNASYGQCIIDHKSDKNFYSHQWWIYLARSQSLWQTERETIELLDQNGKVVDVTGDLPNQ